MSDNAAIDTIGTPDDLDDASPQGSELKTLGSYDAMPYPGGATQSSHPCHLAMVARLCGLSPPPPARSRVLELGCSIGSNLIPMAQDLPDSEFLGVDLSERQIAAGREMVATLGVENIELRHLDISDIDEGFGKFDYIICHGVYSWVPPEVQQSILRIGYQNLSSTGVMLVDYNTKPGWQLRGAIRDMMKFHVADFASPPEQVRQARALLNFLCKYTRSKSEAYAKMLQQEAELLESRFDFEIFHEHLDEFNEPLYFHEFIDRVVASGMRYLADSSIGTMFAETFAEPAASMLRDVPVMRREQYMDFLRGRPFRGSLLCHADLEPDYRGPAKRLLSLQVALRHALTDRNPRGDEVLWKFRGRQLTSQPPVTQAIERLAACFPGWVPVNELVDGLADESDKHVLLNALMATFLQGLIDIADDPPAVGSDVSERPECTPLCRLQAKRGKLVTSRRHMNVILDLRQRFIAMNADGTRTAHELAALLAAAVADGQLKLDGLTSSDERTCVRVVQRTLRELWINSLLRQ